MGLDIYIGKVVKATRKDFCVSTLDYPKLEIFAEIANKVTRKMTNLKVTAINTNQSEPIFEWCDSNEMYMNKRGLYKHAYLEKGVDFKDLVESEKTFYEFDIEEQYDLSYWFSDKRLKPKYYFPFVYKRKHALLILKYLDRDRLFLSDFLKNFKEGTHIIYLNY